MYQHVRCCLMFLPLFFPALKCSHRGQEVAISAGRPVQTRGAAGGQVAPAGHGERCHEGGDSQKRGGLGAAMMLEGIRLCLKASCPDILLSRCCLW